MALGKGKNTKGGKGKGKQQTETTPKTTTMENKAQEAAETVSTGEADALPPVQPILSQGDYGPPPETYATRAEEEAAGAERAKSWVKPEPLANGLIGYDIATFQKVDAANDPLTKLTKAKDHETSDLIFSLPRYGVEEYINDRTIWQKQLYTIGGEQGWFYFKIFFNFNSNYGLLGGLLSENNKPIYAKQSAIAFLAGIEKRYKQEQIPHRMLALYKFGSTLKAIQSETPWLIKGINGLDQINGANIADFGKLKSVDLVMNTETTDMRIGTMLDLYKYACYDSINCKEIIPANLRKFEMTVLCFHVPIKGYQTKIYSEATSTIVTTETTKTKKDGTVKTKTSKSRGDAIPAKTTFMSNTNQSKDLSNMMSFKMFSFKNCEFSTETLDGSIGGSLSNETAFNLGGQNIKITYERVFEHRMNEFGEFFMGDNGFLYNEVAPIAFIGTGDLYENAKNKFRINEQEGQNQQHKRYEYLSNKRTLYEFTDGVIRDANIDATSWGDLNSFSVGRMGKDNLGTRHNSPYLNAKLKALKEGTLHKNVPTTALRSFTTGGFNQLSDFINGFKKKKSAPDAPQNRTGVGDNRKNTDYFNKKLKDMNDGTVSTTGNVSGAKQNRTGTGDNRSNTDYFNEKLRNLDEGTVTDTGGAEQNRTGVGNSRKNTPYFDEKMRNLDEGTLPDNSGAPQNRTGVGNNRTNTDYFNEKLAKIDDGIVQLPGDYPKGLSGGNLHNLHEKLKDLREGTLHDMTIK